MNRSIRMLRLAGALFLLVAVFQGSALGSAQAASCPGCLTGYLCQPCEDGGARLCQVENCCGVILTISCGTCMLHCVLPPA